MCICNPCFIICGNKEFLGTYDNADLNYPIAPKKIYCGNCSSQGPSVYRVRREYCTLCFIPLCLYSTSEPFLCCSKCDFPVGTNDMLECQCGTSVAKECKFCPECGREIMNLDSISECNTNNSRNIISDNSFQTDFTESLSTLNAKHNGKSN